MDRKTPWSLLSNNINMRLTNLFSVVYKYSTNRLSITESRLLYFIRYSWSSSDERIFYLDKNLDPIERDLNIDIFPGLIDFITECRHNKDKIISQLMTRSTKISCIKRSSGTPKLCIWALHGIYSLYCITFSYLKINDFGTTTSVGI